MDINKYRIFLQSVDSGSFSKVAEETGYTPSGIVHMMNTLESEMGFPLLVRSRRGVRLTADGERVAPILRSLVKWEEQLHQVSSDIRGAVSGSITLGCYYSIAVNWLPEVIRQFQKDFPNIKIQMLEAVHQKLDDLLAEQRVDFCVFSAPPAGDVEWIPLRKDRMVAVLPKSHALAKADAYPIANYGTEPLIMPAEGYDYDIMRVLDKHKITPQVSYSTGEDNAALAMIEKELGVGLMNELTTVGRKNTAVILPLDPPESIEMGIAVPSLKKASPAARRFIEYLVRELKEEA
ncbi:MAG: LysR family transcriptional regulator [Oscillospiraceae bacterium]|nr:LysR family transcriptional regulator [Oscillospiraceae bacterium]